MSGWSMPATSAASPRPACRCCWPPGPVLPAFRMLLPKPWPYWAAQRRWAWGRSPMSKTILTVDDSRTMRDMLRLALCEAGHDVIQAEDGVAGVEALLAAGPIDVIITEINMPRHVVFCFFGVLWVF